MDVVEQLEQMRIRMNELARQESNLVAELSEALSAADQQLLQDVRRLAADHEARRGTVLHELQQLAARLNGFPHAGTRRQTLGEAPRAMLQGQAAPHPGAPMPAVPNWEQRSAQIRDALNHHLGAMNGK